MKVLVTDFDGTLYVEDSNVVTINENIAALELFKNEKDIYGRNNIVVVSTAREPKSIMKYINLFKIPCDYVISYMGALIWDCAAEKYIYIPAILVLLVSFYKAFIKREKDAGKD